MPPACGPQPELAIVSRRVYRGANVWSYRRAIHLVVRLGGLEAWPTNRLPGFSDRLLELVPNLAEHKCSRKHAGGFVERLHEGTWLGHVAEHIALALQARTGADTRRGKTRATKVVCGEYNVIYDYEDERVGLRAGDLAVRIVNHLVSAEAGFDPNAEIDAFTSFARRVGFGPSTRSLIDEAVSRGIPWLRLADDLSLVQLGWGVHQKRMQAAVTSATSSIAVEIAKNKNLCQRLLREAGVPVPDQQLVTDIDQAVETAARMPYPVVVKPLDGNHGRGVTVGIETAEAVRAAFGAAANAARRGEVLVERHVRGDDFRVLVVGGEVVAAAQREPAHVIGDGRSTITDLVDAVNLDPRRGAGHEAVLTRMNLDAVGERVLADQGYEPSSVPGNGQRVHLADTANLSTGGTARDCTAELHPDNLQIARTAALVVGLDVAGIDIVAPDLRSPITENGGAVIEVNAGPGFRMHTDPSSGDAQYVAKAVIDGLFPTNTTARIPVIAVTGTNGKTTVTRMIATIAQLAGLTVGQTSTDGIHIDGRRVRKGDSSGPKSARMVLRNPTVDMAVLEVARGGILREGLGYDYSDVAVVLNVSEDHLGMGGINTLGQLANVKRVVVEAVPRAGYAVLNADDPLVAAMRRSCRGQVIWFSDAASNPLVERHCARGGRAVVLETIDGRETIVVRDGRRRLPISDVNALPSTFAGAARMNVRNALAATAAALGVGLHAQHIRTGLRAFTTSVELAPGRLNVTTTEGVTLVLDYGHNPAAVRAVGDFAQALAKQRVAAGNHPPRLIAVVSTAGDRRNQDLTALGEAAAEKFDAVIVKEDDNLRGRASGEVPQLIAAAIHQRISAGTARCDEVRRIPNERTAVGAALGEAKPGDVVVAFVDNAADYWPHPTHA